MDGKNIICQQRGLSDVNSDERHFDGKLHANFRIFRALKLYLYIS